MPSFLITDCIPRLYFLLDSHKCTLYLNSMSSGSFFVWQQSKFGEGERRSWFVWGTIMFIWPSRKVYYFSQNAVTCPCYAIIPLIYPWFNAFLVSQARDCIFCSHVLDLHSHPTKLKTVMRIWLVIYCGSRWGADADSSNSTPPLAKGIKAFTNTPESLFLVYTEIPHC